MKNILVPTDFSPSAGNALNYAVLLAKEMDAKIILLNVIPMPDYTTGIVLDAAIVEEFNVNTKNLLKEKEQYIHEIAPEVNSESFIATGFAWSEILSVAQNTNADLIIIGKHGTGNLNKILGTTASELINKADCALLVISDQGTFHPFKKIAFATDFNDNEIPSIKLAVEWVRKSDATLILIHISEDRIKKSIKSGTPEEFLKKLITEHNLQNLKVDVRAAENIVESLEEYSLKENVDLLVMAHNKRTFFSQINHPSISRKMSFDLRCPLLLLPLVN